MSSSASSRDEAALAEFLTFFIDGEEYAVPLRRVREVIAFDTLTRVPQLPPCIRGVTNLRGSVVPVIDLALKLFGHETPVHSRTCIVLVELAIDGAPTMLGVMTEAVGQVLALASEDMLPPPSFGAPVRTEFLAGMGRVGKKFALLLELDWLLSAAELLAVEDPGETRVSEPPPVEEQRAEPEP